MSAEIDAKVLMPKATAVWLIENTSLTFEQIATFCGLHVLEINAIADGDSMQGMQGISPISMGQLTQEEIERCQKSPSEHLRLYENGILASESVKTGKGRYTPRARRGDRPDAIAWLIKQYPNLTDAQIIRLIGTTKATIEAIRKRQHWNIANIKPRSPVVLGFCGQAELDALIAKIPRDPPPSS